MATLVDFRRDLALSDPAKYDRPIDPAIRRMIEDGGNEVLPAGYDALDLSQLSPDGEALPSPGPGWFVYRVTVESTKELFVVATHEAHPYRVLGGPWPAD